MPLEDVKNFRDRMNKKRKNDRKNSFPNLAVQIQEFQMAVKHETIRHENKHGDQSRASLSQVANLMPTPRATVRGDCPSERRRKTPDLSAFVNMVPTPAAQDAKNATLPPSQIDRGSISGALLRGGESGQLNPDWVDWLMGLPSGWTDVDRDMKLPEYDPHFFDTEPPIPRVAAGIKNRVARLTMDGNGVVPQQVYPIFAAIAEIERTKNNGN